MEIKFEAQRDLQVALTEPSPTSSSANPDSDYHFHTWLESELRADSLPAWSGHLTPADVHFAVNVPIL